MYYEEGKGVLYVQLCLYISSRDDSRVSMTSYAVRSLNSAVSLAGGMVLHNGRSCEKYHR